MKKCFAPLLILFMLSMAGRSRAQLLVVHVEPGETMYVASGEIFHAYGLGLMPNVTLDLSGISIYRKPVLTNNGLMPAIQRAYTFTPTAPSFSGLYKFWYDDGELNGIPESNLQLWRFSTSWGVVTKASHDETENVMTSQTVTINPTELTLAPATGLPVTWLDVAAGKKEKNVDVTWKTAEESDLDTYTVMHSMNSTQWTPLGNVVPKGAAENNYSFLHVNAPAGKNYYRIRAKELTGEIKYSKIVSVSMDDRSQLSIYPNPATGRQNATLRLSKPGVVQIWRINGTLVSSNYYNAGVHSISTAGLTAGTYLISSGEQIIQWIIQ